MNVMLYLDGLYVWVYRKVVKSYINYVSIKVNHYCRCVFRDQLPGMVGTEGNVSFVRGYSVIIWMQRKGVNYCPVIMRYATVKRELAQDRCIVTYVQFG